MLLNLILSLLCCAFLISGTIFFVVTAKMFKRYVKQYDTVYADIEDVNKD